MLGKFMLASLVALSAMAIPGVQTQVQASVPPTIDEYPVCTHLYLFRDGQWQFVGHFRNRREAKWHQRNTFAGKATTIYTDHSCPFRPASLSQDSARTMESRTLTGITGKSEASNLAGNTMRGLHASSLPQAEGRVSTTAASLCHHLYIYHRGQPRLVGVYGSYEEAYRAAVYQYTGSQFWISTGPCSVVG